MINNLIVEKEKEVILIDEFKKTKQTKLVNSYTNNNNFKSDHFDKIFNNYNLELIDLITNLSNI